MTKKARISSKPPALQTVDSFIEAAEEPKHSHSNDGHQEELPWEADWVREDIKKSINLRLSEPYILKLQFLSEKTHKSQQQFIREVLCPAIDGEIEKIIGT